MTIKTAIMGPGKIAGAYGNLKDAIGKPAFTHAHAISADSRYSLSAVVGCEQSEADVFADRWDVPSRFTNIGKMLSDVQPDLLVITTPDSTHAEAILAALGHSNAPRVIICEKPVCMNMSELLKIDSALNAAPGSLLLINQSLRLAQNFTAVRDLITSHEFGAPMMARWVYYGGWMHNGVHLVDMLPLVFGTQAKLVSAKESYADREGDPCIDATFKIGDIQVHLESIPEYAFQLGEGEIRLTKGRIRMTEFCSQIFVDTPIQNDIGEIELKPKSQIDYPNRPTPMEHLYQLCGDFLVSDDNRVISLVGMDAIRPTMQHLFNAIEVSRTTSE